MPQSPASQLLQEDQMFAGNTFDFECLDYVDMVADIYPLFHLLSHYLLFFFAGDLLVAVGAYYRIFLLEYQVGWRVHLVDWAFLDD